MVNNLFMHFRPYQDVIDISDTNLITPEKHHCWKIKERFDSPTNKI
jgi:phage/plasmid-associated DNA primase